MIACRWLVLFFLLLVSTTVFASGRAGVTLTHFEPVDRLAIRSGGIDGAAKPGDLGPIQLSFETLGRSFDLELVPNANLLAAVSGAGRGDAVAYEGGIAGVADSWARIVIAEGVPSGLIWDGYELVAIEPPGSNIAGSPGMVGFRLADVIVEPGALSCASGGSVAKTGADVFKTIVSEANVSTAPGAGEEIEIGVLADFEAFGIHGATTNAEILTRFNNVDGIYSQQISLQVSPQIEVFNDVNDPFTTPADPTTNETNASALLTELRDYRSGDSGQRALGLTHLYTGRDLEGSTAGIAYVDVVCRSNAGVGLSEISNSPTIDALVAAHEIGHNFGASHDGDSSPGATCPSAPLNHIMAPSVSPANNTFSDCSVGVIRATADAAQCISPLLDYDVSVAFSGSDSTVLLTNSFQVGVDVSNLGINDATGVAVDVVLPANVNFVDATGASCTENAGTVSCAIGTITAGAAASFDVSTDSVAAGSGSFTATVSADADDRASNDQDTVQLTVDPAVNLVIESRAAAQVNLDQSTNVSVTLQNLSTLDATDVTLSVSLNAALQANSASLSIGSCTVAAQQVDCQASLFANQTSATFNIDVTGLSAGNKGYTLNLASAEVDADTSDNSFTGTVNVADPKNDDGGGSLVWLLLALLVATSLRAKRICSSQ
jgi:hypothetical protein